MIDLRGNLVGINTAILAGGSGGSQGVGFAIPINLARSVMDQLVSHGKVVRGYLGVYIQDVTPSIAKQFGLNQNNGVLIGDVSADTPGARAGLKRGDIVTELNGEPVKDAGQLRLRISQTPPGTTVKLRTWRDSKSQDVSVTLGELPPDKSAGGFQGEEGAGEVLEGVEVQELTPDIAQQLDLAPGTRGVVVASVDPASAAEAAGLERGDVIQEVNHKRVTNIQEYKQAMKEAGNQPVLLLINQHGITRYIVIEGR
jgi:serine protease Do